MKVGFVTIGQAPRTDVTADIAPLMPGVNLLEAGALDDLKGPDLAAVAPDGRVNDLVLTSRLRDGSPVIMSKAKVYPLVQAAVNRVVAQGARIVVILCTGEFSRLQAPVPLLFPDRLLIGFVQAVLPEGASLGVMVPLAEQQRALQARWQTLCPDVRVISLSPYAGFEEGVEKVRVLAGVSLVVMDCLGYSRQHKAAVQARVDVPVVLARTVVARAIQELLLKE